MLGSVPRACIDVGSNTIRLLVAEVRDGRLRELASRREFTRLGRSVSALGLIPGPKIAEAARVVAEQAVAARRLGAPEVAVVATAAVRGAANHAELVAAVESRAGVSMRILTAAEEARLSFVGATRTMDAAPSGPVGVVDVGGGSTEVVAGTVTSGPTWSRSVTIGSGLLTDRCLRSDPPQPAELEAVRAQVSEALEGLDAPPMERAVAAGGSASSLRRVVGERLDPASLERCLALLSASSAAELAERLDLHAERVRLLPAGVLILDGLARRLATPLTIGNGGLREGLILELEGAPVESKAVRDG